MSAEIVLKCENQRLVIDEHGGGIKEYYLQDGMERFDLICGYVVESEKTGSMGDVLFPFPGRIEDSKYEFEGQSHELSGLKQKNGHAIHGFAKLAEWRVVHESEDSAKLSFVITKEDYAPKGFPFDLVLILEYSLSVTGVHCKATVENVGETNAPFGLGFHPYFTLDGKKVDDLILKVAAQKLVEFDASLKPTGKFIDVPATELNFQNPKQIGDMVIDNCFTSLIYDERGFCTTEIMDSDGNKIFIWQDENLPYLQLYSADTIGEKKRRCGLAVEPQTCTGFILNKPEMGLRILSPGEVFGAEWGVGYLRV
ncbi:MAG TPA: hypothetical protein PK263_00040 [bacterium]|nr:hypothetical protein [bacterium]